MKNIPYVKQFRTEKVTENSIEYILTYTDELLNPITKDKPYMHNFKSVRGQSLQQYHIIRHHLTGAYIGRLKVHGNNRANTSKRKGVHSRIYHI